MEFSYTEFEVKPTPSSSRKISVFRPMIPVTILYNNKLVQYAALIDSGADYNIFHGDIAAYLGIKISTGSRRNISGINRGQVKGYEHAVKLKIGNNVFKSKISFSDQLPSNAIAVLGNRGFFDKFVVTLDYNNKKIDIA